VLYSISRAMAPPPGTCQWALVARAQPRASIASSVSTAQVRTQSRSTGTVVPGPRLPLVPKGRCETEQGLRHREGSTAMVSAPRMTGLRPLNSSTVRYTP
jgi:hypothetical protein